MGTLKSLAILTVGVYGGLYCAQTYEIPRIYNPTELFEKFRCYMSNNESAGGGVKNMYSDAKGFLKSMEKKD
ncbi:hypothetical protein SNEBB_006406 [Seison nebaliae]|nr:hypothetical protein SNEBB_006406 [Seison nebaliae]